MSFLDLFAFHPVKIDPQPHLLSQEGEPYAILVENDVYDSVL